MGMVSTGQLPSQMGKIEVHFLSNAIVLKGSLPQVKQPQRQNWHATSQVPECPTAVPTIWVLLSFYISFWRGQSDFVHLLHLTGQAPGLNGKDATSKGLELSASCLSI